MEFLDQYSAAWLAGLVVALLATGVIAGVMAGLLGVGGLKEGAISFFMGSGC